MPKLIIDDRKIEVAPGTKVIEAAAQLGIMIPRFCYHPALGAVGACRVCAVKFLEGPLKGVQMSCMVTASDGMVVSTTDAEAVDFRRQVIEWLMLNHPHDCPVCDEGGQCLLQDMTVSGGHAIRRYPGNKRTFYDQHLGPLIQHEMNRCIHCYRCVRFYQDFCGYRDLGVMGSADRTYFGRQSDGVLESPFSGNLTDICPTGVFTDKPARFYGRHWDFQRTPSLCIHCSLGCHTVTNVRYRKIVRQEAGFSAAVNGYFICDRGRYGFTYHDSQQRPRRAKIQGRPVPFDRALQAAQQKLAAISRQAGTGAVAAVGSLRSSLQTQAMLKRLCRLKGWPDPAYFTDPAQAVKVKTASARLTPASVVSLDELQGADFILVVGADPVNEAPLLALALRQARRRGAAVVVIDPRPVFLPLQFTHLPTAAADLAACLARLMKSAVNPPAAAKPGLAVTRFYAALEAAQNIDLPLSRPMLDAGRALGASRRPVIVCGTGIVSVDTPDLAADVVLLLQATDRRPGLFYLLPGANAFGAALLSDAPHCLAKTIEDIEAGTVRALVLVENDAWRNFADRQRLERALAKLDLLVVMDYLASPAVDRADSFLPTATVFEAGGAFINQEGRLQAAAAADAGGLPLAQVAAAGHPPRIYSHEIPGGEPRPAGQILAQLAGGGDRNDASRPPMPDWPIDLVEAFKTLPPMDELAPDGVRLTVSDGATGGVGAEAAAGLQPRRRPKDALALLLVEWTFGTETLSAASPPLAGVEKDPCLLMHPDDARRLGLENGDRVTIRSASGRVETRLQTAANMAPQTLVLPRHRRLPWQQLGTGSTWIRPDQIRKAPP